MSGDTTGSGDSPERAREKRDHRVRGVVGEPRSDRASRLGRRRRAGRPEKDEARRAVAGEGREGIPRLGRTHGDRARHPRPRQLRGLPEGLERRLARRALRNNPDRGQTLLSGHFTLRAPA